jgi:hypothetical protein
MLFSRDEVLKRTTSSVRDALARQAGHQFDPRIVLETLEYLATHRPGNNGEAKVVKVALPVLRPGMVLARDIVSSQGALLMPCDTHLTVTHVERIRNFARVDSLSAILVYASGDEPEFTVGD